MVDNRPESTQTPLSQYGVSLQPGVILPVGGLVSNKGNLSRGGGEWAILNNLEQIIPGVWTSKGIGWKRDRPAAFNGGQPFMEFGTFTDPLTGTDTMLFQVSDTLYSYNKTTHVETMLKNALNAAMLPCMRGFFSIITGAGCTVYVNGDIEPRKITSPTTEGPLKFNGTNWPGTFNSKTYTKPKLVEPFGNAMVYGAFQSASIACDILISQRGDPETFVISTPLAETDAVAFTYPAALGRLTSIRSHQISNQATDEVLICGCTKGIFMITGNSASTYALKILTRQMGILSNRCFIEFGNDLLFLASNGVQTLSNLANNQVLVPDSKSDPILDYIKVIDKSVGELSHAFHNPVTQTMHFWVSMKPLDNQQNGHALVINYNTIGGSSAQIEPLWSTRDGAFTACSIFFEDQVYCGGYDGVLQDWYQGNTYDDQPLHFTVRSPICNLGGSPVQAMSLRDVQVICDGDAQSFILSAYVTQKLKSGQWHRTLCNKQGKPLKIAALGETELGKWTLGLSAFPSLNPKLLGYQFKGEGNFWEFEITSTSSDDAIDLVGIAYTMSGGGIQR